MGCQLNKPFNVYEAADTWYQTVSAIDVEAYYRERVLKLNKVTFVSKIASGIYDPKIFDVMKPAKAARFAAIDASTRMEYHAMEWHFSEKDLANDSSIVCSNGSHRSRKNGKFLDKPTNIIGAA